MEINLTCSSVLTAIITSTTIWGYLFLYIQKKKTSYSSREVNIIITCFIIWLVRLFLPVEILNFTRTIAISKGYPIIHDFLKMDIGHHIKVVNIICAIWIIGSFVILGYKLSNSIRQLNIIKKYGSFTGTIMAKTIFGRTRQIKIIKMDYISSPFLAGLIHPIIVLPKRDLAHMDLIMHHELEHFRRHDLILKGLFELLSIVYWWNPLIYLIKFYFGNMLELQNDICITKKLPMKDKIIYAEILLETAKQKNNSNITASFSGSFLAPRIKSILENKKEKNKSFLLYIPIVTTILSTCIIFEPVTPPLRSSNQFSAKEISMPGSYLEHVNNEYKLYINGRFIGTINNIPSDLKSLEIQEGE